ncbi:MAG: carboxypeptidase-like regulatory domain-containing protein [Bryobacteraceae bacterium]|nr:carboxypeptidase-like regulatory domain-containing protein [Bryobacteraceae bacterium]
MTVEGPNGVNRQSVFTDQSGQFHFPGLPAGLYFLKGEKTGYAPTPFGQRGNAPRGAPLVLEGNSEFFATLRLRRLGAVNGRVLDENGAGLPGITVYAYRQGPPLRIAAAGTSDDRGVYRIAGLRADRYLIRTGARTLEDGTGVLPTYYGDSIAASGARLLTVKLDADLSQIDIVPQAGRLSSLIVVVDSADEGTVTLRGEATKRSAGAGGGAVARFEELEPGSYTLHFEAGKLSAFREVTLARENESVTLDPAPAPTLTVRCREPGGGTAPPGALSAFIRPLAEGETSQMQRIACGETIAVQPGEWELLLAAQLTHFVASVTNVRPGESSYRLRLLPSQQQNVEVLVSAKPASVSGEVKTSDGAPAIGVPVMLQAQGDLAARLGGERRIEADEKGRYQFLGLPPGRYEIYISYGSEEEGASLPRKQVVVVEEGEKKILDIRLQEE